MSAHETECLLHARAGVGRQDAFGLLDEDSAVQCGLQLLGEDDLIVHGAFVQEADGGNVGHPLGDGKLVVAEPLRADGEEVQRADHLTAQPERQSVARGEPLPACGLGEYRPPVGGGRQVDVGDDSAGGEAVQARALLPLQLEELQQPR